MTKLECSAVIENKQERRAIMAWIKSSKAESYSEVGNTVSITYKPAKDDPEASSTWWGMIHVFEQYPEHTINGS